MVFHVREARPDDVAAIVPWTTDTFAWGDYVPDRLPGWIDAPESHVVVCTADDDLPIAVAHALMLSPTEAWLEAARVHPDFRRKGLGSAMNRDCTAWAAGRGARVARLASEATNTAARHQVEALGYRHTSSWAYAELTPTVRSLLGEGRRLQPAPAADVAPAWMAWSAGDLSRVGRELTADGWRWRRAQVEDLSDAAQRGDFLQSPAGWVTVTQPQADWVRCGWMATTPEEAPVLLAGLRDLALDRNVAEIDLMVPWTPWMNEALTRSDATPHQVVVYSLSL
jgi:GNAT superfamily N-acetyltransferase